MSRGRVIHNALISILFLAIFYKPSMCLASRCKPPSSSKIEQIRQYLAKIQGLNTEELRLVNSGEEGNACYWKLQFDPGAPKRVITAYLSPNRKFISNSEPLDLESDPITEQGERNLDLQKTMIAGNPPTQGSSTASVTIVEFVDYECAYCANQYSLLKKVLDNDNNVKLVYRSFPIEKHTWAKNAAEMSE